MKATILLSLTLTLLTPTPSLSYTYRRYPPATGQKPEPTPTLAPAAVQDVVEDVMEQQQETADQYLEGLLTALNSYQTPEEVQEKLEEQAQQALDAHQQYGGYVQDVVESLLNVMHGSDNDTDDDAATGASQTQTQDQGGSYIPSPAPTTVSFVLTTTEADEDDQNVITTPAPASYSTVADDDSDDDDSNKEVTTTVAPATVTDDDDDEQQKEEEEEEATTPSPVVPTTTTEEEEEDSDDKDVTTLAPVSVPDDNESDDDKADTTTTTTTTPSPVSTTEEEDEDEESEENEDNVHTTVAPVITTTGEGEDNEKEDDDVSEEATTPATVNRTLSTVDDEEEEEDSDEVTPTPNDDDSHEVTYGGPPTTTTTKATTTTTTKATTTTTEEDDDSAEVTTSQPTVTTTEDDDDSDEVTENEVTTKIPKTTTNLCKNGAGYNPHPTDCALFVQCIRNQQGEAVVAAVVPCPHGLFWSQRRFVCDFKWNVDCNPATTTPKTTTTTTTTPATTTTTAAPTTKPVDVPNMCTGCQFKHGVGYNPHPSDCTLFVQCRLNEEGKVEVAGVHSCAHGLYWNQAKLTCDHQSNVQCVDDICRSGSMKKVKRSGATCRGFWDCRSGVAQAKCCAAGFAFNPVTQRCHYDTSCQDACLPEHTVVNYQCNGMRSVPGNRNAFEMKTADGVWVRLNCPASLAFTAYPCGCNEPLDKPVPQPQCAPELYLPFKTDAKDYSGHEVAVKNNGVVVKYGKAIFNGQSNLTVNFFSNIFWGDLVYVHLRYRFRSAASGVRQALVTNGDCGERPSLAMCADTQGVDFYAETKSSPMPANLTVPFGNVQGARGWKDVLYRLDGGYLSGFVNTNMVVAPAAGPLETRQRALVIGGGGGCANFVGYISELTVYRCRPHSK